MMGEYDMPILTTSYNIHYRHPILIVWEAGGKEGWGHKISLDSSFFSRLFADLFCLFIFETLDVSKIPHKILSHNLLIILLLHAWNKNNTLQTEFVVENQLYLIYNHYAAYSFEYISFLPNSLWLSKSNNCQNVS